MSASGTAAAAAGGAGGVAGGGVAGVLGLLVLTECGLPLPVPADLLMLLVGQQAAAGTLPLWLAAVAFVAVAVMGTTAGFLLARGPGRAVLARLGPRVGLGPERVARATDLVVRRGRPMLAVGRLTPGLRTLTVLAAASTVPAAIALPLLVLGSTVFLEAHLVLGYVLGAAAGRVLAAAGPIVVALVVLLALAALARAVLRRLRSAPRATDAGLDEDTYVRADVRADVRGWAEAACPACLLVTAATARSARLAGAAGPVGPPVRPLRR